MSVLLTVATEEEIIAALLQSGYQMYVFFNKAQCLPESCELGQIQIQHSSDATQPLTVP